MGIINVTPDSFSDGGRFFQAEQAIEQGLRLAQDGADILDIGGESTRPGSEPVTVEEELKRIIPVIENLAQKVRIPISIDTYKAEVAKRALEAGAEIINDISALRFDPEMVKAAREFNCPVVLMHIQGTPRQMQENPVYQDVIGEIKAYFQRQIAYARQNGLDESQLIIDPGIGFGKTLEHNLGILQGLSKFQELGRPILLGVSRKSFVGKILDLPVEDRLEGSLAAMAYAILQGANIVRVHDVRESVRAARIIDELKESSP
jgi:dihydropteroate synthase